MNTPLSSIAWIVLGSMIGSIGALYLKLGANHLHGLRSLLTNWRLGLGVFFYLLSAVVALKGLKHGELSVLYPMVSVGAVFTFVWAKIFLGEELTRTKVIAVGMILIGCVLLALGGVAQPPPR